MAAVNDGLRIYQEDAFIFARDEAGLVNVAATRRDALTSLLNAVKESRK
jgi:hypothetical protein